MYKDIINYELADGTTEERLLSVGKQIVNDWMKKLPGFVAWEIHTNSNGSYTDIVYWETKKDAKNANDEMKNIPNAGDWYKCYNAGSIKSQNVTLVERF